MSRRQDRYIHLSHLCNRFQTETETTRSVVGTRGWTVRPRTVRNRLEEFHLRPHHPHVGWFPMYAEATQYRMQWLLARVPYRLYFGHCRCILFTEEFCFTLYRSGGRQCVYQRRGARYFDTCLSKSNIFGRGYVVERVGYWRRKNISQVSHGNLMAVTYRD